jgi:hypothetical protein
MSQPYTTMSLTEEEVAIIQKRRRHQQKNNERRTRNLHVLALAHTFYAWCMNNQQRPESVKAFCDFLRETGSRPELNNIQQRLHYFHHVVTPLVCAAERTTSGEASK